MPEMYIPEPGLGCQNRFGFGQIQYFHHPVIVASQHNLLLGRSVLGRNTAHEPMVLVGRFACQLSHVGYCIQINRFFSQIVQGTLQNRGLFFCRPAKTQ